MLKHSVTYQSRPGVPKVVGINYYQLNHPQLGPTALTQQRNAVLNQGVHEQLQLHQQQQKQQMHGASNTSLHESSTTMVPNWKSWCRLCAREDPTKMNINKLEPTFLDAISKFVSIDIKVDDSAETICTRCHEYVTDFINFVHRTTKVQTMFAELLDSHKELDLEQLKSKYELCDDKRKIKKHFGSNPSIAEFGVIDEEMENTSHIKTEELDEGEFNISQKEWQPEQEDNSSEDGESILETTKSEEQDEDSEEKPTVKKRGRPKKKPETFSCSSCYKQFISYPKYTHHMKEDHGVTVESLPYTCSKCSKSFSTQNACNKHEITHQSHQQKLTVCPYCGKEFKQNNLSGHIREIHVGEKPFVCDDCGKAYTTSGNLKEHKMTHSEERPFKCNYCEKSFKNKSRLKVHEDTHNVTNYICTSCGLQLNTRRTLRMHMLVHSDQRRHKCGFCGNEYKRAKALKTHLILHTGLKPYTCNFCDKAFANVSNCRSHKKKAHPIELAAMEATGTKVINTNIPKLQQLRAITSNKSVRNQVPMVQLGKEFGSTVSIVSLRDENDEQWQKTHLRMDV